MGMIQEFKEFALKGNMIDMAVGIVMGGAVGGVVKSMVDNLVNPIVGLFTGQGDFGTEFLTLREGVAAADGVEEVPALVLGYGNFIGAFINFLILAFVIFMIIKVVNAAKKRLVEEAPEAPKGPTELELLTEIRDSLKRD